MGNPNKVDVSKATAVVLYGADGVALDLSSLASGGPQKELVRAEVAMASDDTQYSCDIPEGAIGVVLRLGSTVKAWRWSDTDAEVAGGDGFPVAAGESIEIAGPSLGQTIYVAHTAGAAQVLHVAYERVP